MDIYKRLLQYIKPYLGSLLWACGLMVLASFGDVLVSGVIYITTNSLVNKEFVTLSGIPHIPPQLAVSFSITWVPIIIIAVFVFRGFVGYFSKYLMAKIGLKTVRDIRNELYRRVSYLSCDFFSEKRSGDLMSRITGDVNVVQASITTITLDLIKSPFTILFTIPIVFIMGGKLAFFGIVIFPLVAIPIVLLGKKLRKLTTRFLERNADIISFMQETFIGIRIVKAFNAEEIENKKFNEITESIYKFCLRSMRAIELQRPVIEIMGAAGVGMAIFFALKTLPIDRFMTFAGTLYLLYEPAKKLSNINIVIQKSIASGKRIFEVMDATPSIKEKGHALQFTDSVHQVAYDSVFFFYENNNDVLKNITFTVKKGQSVAIIGASGSGKSTLMSLLPRFFDPQKGMIRINDIDIQELTLKSLRNLIGIVSQETILFNGTVCENISYGKPNASREEVIGAAQAAYAHNFILDLPKGYDTYLGERGLKLSGGQRQRISIARAILKNPPILIFDEATSHLDTESEREVQRAIENLMKGRTVFVIAHRLSTVQNVDFLIVLEEGRMVQQGTHKELIGQDGQYKRLFDLQFNI